ncbi:MAG: HAD family hydrolase [Thaumarchaeota archaeon]|nr:HAD family hydrolase [Nitrososphaerota archaeon]
MTEFHKAVFLDRDGVVNKERADYVKKVDELVILDVANSIKKLRDGGFLIIVISNQSAVNRGLTTHENVKKIHSTIQDYLEKGGTQIDAFYYCPHRPDENCNCRKPKPGLLNKAINDLKIDPKLSWMIGDRDSDIEAAKLVGCKFVKIISNSGLDYAVQRILNSSDF